ncbi:MAG: 3'-5' exonuclease [Bacteroidales bacterium]|jgi:DNA polymerase elongation subunit (family B)|nr:3'-5' exonuclease [Bacteroidales bacterium]
MLEHINLEDILFLDIETVPQYPDFSLLDESSQHLWEEKTISGSFRKKEEEQTVAQLYERAGIYAEFGKIVCISTCYLYRQQNEWAFRVKSCFHDDESQLLNEFNQLLESFAQRHNTILCAHNGKEFDFPYIARRMLINGIGLPAVLNIAGKKPWEVSFLDTMDLWRFGDYKSYTSLKLLTHIFGIPSPKDDIDGSQVCGVYWNEKDLPRIARYCEKDVLAVVQILLRYRGLPVIPVEKVSSSSFPANPTATFDTIHPTSASE